MRIAVVGCGLSGSLLAYLTPKLGHKLDVYDIDAHPKAVCGCGIPTNLFREIAEACNLDSETYILWHGRKLFTRFMSGETEFVFRNLCTFDKQKFITDLIDNSDAHFHFGERLPRQRFSNYDLIVDASGVRAVLGALPTDTFYVCHQVRAAFSTRPPYPDFFMDFSGRGETYLWMFPLSQFESYVGLGSRKGSDARAAVLRFVKGFHGSILREQSRRLRLNPPHESLPLTRGNIVGVGNSIGAITMLGEGNALSVETVKTLLDHLADPQQYEREILEKLGWLKHDHAVYDAWVKNKKLKLLYHLIKCRKHYVERYKIRFKESLSWLAAYLKNRPPPSFSER